jgi:hypothetical protein
MKREGNKMGEMKLDQKKDERAIHESPLQALDEELAEDLEKAELSEEAVTSLKAALKSLNKFMEEFPNELKRALNTLALFAGYGYVPPRTYGYPQPYGYPAPARKSGGRGEQHSPLHRTAWSWSRGSGMLLKSCSKEQRLRGRRRQKHQSLSRIPHLPKRS